jgi:hypothetical protein
MKLEEEIFIPLLASPSVNILKAGNWIILTCFRQRRARGCQLAGIPKVRMPVETHYVDGGKGAHKHAYGVLTSTDILVTGLIQAKDVENTRKLKYQLYDFTDVVEYQVGRDVVRELVEINRKTASVSRGALGAIVAPNPLVFGLAREWQSFAGDLGWKAQVFNCREDAIRWLRTELGGGDAESPLLEEYPSLKMEK